MDAGNEYGITEYLGNQEAYDNLTDEQLQALARGETVKYGDTEAAAAAPESEETPAPAADPEPKEDGAPKAVEAKAEDEPVVLTKDGKHTIPYSELIDAREAAKKAEKEAIEATALAASLKAEVEAAKAVKAEPTEPEAPFGDYSDKALKDGVEKLVAQRVAETTAALEAKFAETLAPMQKALAETATATHFKAIYDAHPDTDQILEKPELGKWMDAQPSFVRDQYKAVLDKGTSAQVVELLNAFKASLPAAPEKPAVAEPTKAEIAAKAAATVAKAKGKTPTSLSDVPSGTITPVDEMEAMEKMNSTQLLTKMHGKSPKQILDLLSRVA